MDRILLIIFLLMLPAWPVLMDAQPRSAGGVFSFSGIECSYQHDISDSSFVEIRAGIDFDGILEGYTMFPGARLGVGYDFVFLERRYPSGDLSLYAGPGFTAGFVREGRDFGFMAGLTGEAGVEYRFRVPVILSLSFAPVVGLFLHKDGNQTKLDSYMNGLRYSYYPRVGIKYSF